MKSAIFALCLAPCGALAQHIDVTFHDREGNDTGSAALTGTPHGVLITLDLAGMPPSGWLAFHAHETGSCDPADDHESAGGHFNPGGVEHGFLTETGPHAGDMPNVYSDASGVVRAEVFTSRVTLTEGDTALSGRALILHAGPDDHRSQPSGDAGDRLACAVVP